MCVSETRTGQDDASVLVSCPDEQDQTKNFVLSCAWQDESFRRT